MSEAQRFEDAASSPAALALQGAGEVDLLRQAARWQEAGKNVAIATTIACWGSAPRRVGSRLAVTSDGQFAGSVSGGCVENAVITAARACLEDGAPRQLDYLGDPEMPWEVGLPCGGSISVYVEPCSEKFSAALRSLDAGHITAIATNLETGAAAWLSATEAGGDAETASTVQAVLPDEPRQWRPGMLSEPASAPLFVDVLRPAPRLVIIGATHLAQSLVAMAGIYGYEVILIDPREAYFAEARFGAIKQLVASPGPAVAALAPDANTAIIVVSHDPKIDDPALIEALRSEAFYIGALGSRKSQAARLDRLRAAGFAEEALDRIHGPVGLSIGAITPSEIAGSILAQMTQILRATL
jgi:xanthine dehydrogenase accessory factor